MVFDKEFLKYVEDIKMEQLSLPELQNLARQKGLAGWSRLNKKQLQTYLRQQSSSRKSPPRSPSAYRVSRASPRKPMRKRRRASPYLIKNTCSPKRAVVPYSSCLVREKRRWIQENPGQMDRPGWWETGVEPHKTEHEILADLLSERYIKTLKSLYAEESRARQSHQHTPACKDVDYFSCWSNHCRLEDISDLIKFASHLGCCQSDYGNPNRLDEEVREVIPYYIRCFLEIRGKLSDYGLIKEYGKAYERILDRWSADERQNPETTILLENKPIYQDHLQFAKLLQGGAVKEAREKMMSSNHF